MRPDTTFDIRSTAKQLHKIVAIARFHLLLRSHPKINVTLVCIGYVLVAFVLYYLQFAAPFRLPTLVVFGMTISIGIASIIFCVWIYRRQSNIAYHRRVFSLLATYNPVEREAYEILLERLEREEFLVEDDILEWAKVEQPAVDRLLRAASRIKATHLL